MDIQVHVDTLILIPTGKIYIFLYSRRSDRWRYTLALRGLEEPAHALRELEEPFFQLCCCIVSVFGSGGK